MGIQRQGTKRGLLNELTAAEATEAMPRTPLRPASELNRIPRGAYIRLELSDGTDVTGISHGSGWMPEEVQAIRYSEARAKGYRGPVPGDTLSFETVHRLHRSGTFIGLAARSVLVQCEGDSAPTPCALDLMATLRCDASVFDPRDAARWIEDHPTLDGRVLLLTSEQLSAGRAMPGAVPIADITGFMELNPKPPALRNDFGTIAGLFTVGVFCGFLTSAVVLGAGH